MKQILKSKFFAFLLGAVIFGSIGVVSAYSILANDIGYTPNDTTWEVDNVKNAIDDLYTTANTTLSTKNQQISTLTQSNSTLSDQVSSLTTENHTLQTQLNKSISSFETVLACYGNGSSSGIRIGLGTQALPVIGNYFTYFKILTLTAEPSNKTCNFYLSTDSTTQAVSTNTEYELANYKYFKIDSVNADACYSRVVFYNK